MNSYNLYDPNYESTILYHAIAENEEQVRILASEANYDIEGLVIELERTNVVDQLRRPFHPSIKDALIH